MTSIRLAVRQFCVQCMGGEGVPGVREDVRGCTAKGCPLYRWRPFRAKGELTPAQASHAERMARNPGKYQAPPRPKRSGGPSEGPGADAA